MAYLSKSDFKVAQTCPTKLYYKKNGYANSLNENEYMQMLADGGYLIGNIAQMMFEQGIDLSDSESTKVAIEKTEELLLQKNVTIFEAAIQVENYLIRIDVLEKIDNTFNLIEVKSKSFDGVEATSKTNYFSNTKFKPYIDDLAFQHFVLQKKFKDAQINSFLMMPDKSETASIDGILGWFKIVSPETDNTNSFRKTIVEFVGTEQNKIDLQNEPWLKKVDLTELVLNMQNDIETNSEKYVEAIVANKKIETQINVLCRDCEFRSEVDKSGFHECWGELAKPQPHILSLGQLGNVNKKDNCINDLIKSKKTALLDVPISYVTKEEIDNNTNEPKPFYNNRPLYQLTKTEEFLLDGFNSAISTIQYPLYFLDFETSNMAVPLHKDMRPYENVIFQWSVHKLNANGNLEHFEWINVDDIYPNHKCIQALYDCVGKTGTVFTWSKYENTQLRKTLESLEFRGEDNEELKKFIQNILIDKESNYNRQIDLNELALKYYFHPKMGGRTSIKVTLPAVLSEKTKTTIALLVENSFYKIDDNGTLIDPYKTLPTISINNVEINDDKIESVLKTLNIHNGGVAMTAYREMMFGFGKNNTEAKTKIKNALLQYCKLDTLAMVIIWKHWLMLIKN